MIELRPGRDSDVPAIVRIVNAADTDTGFGRATTEEEIRRDWADSEVEPARDLALALDPDGREVGFAVLSHHPGNAEHVLWCEGCVHPDHRRRGAGTRLMRWALDAARTRAAGLPGPNPVLLRAYAREEEAGTRALFDAVSLAWSHEVFDLARPLADLAPPPPPEGIEIAPYRPETDAAAARVALNEAFAEERNVVPREGDRWDWFVSRSRPDLWMLAFDGEECAGAVYPDVETERNEREGAREGLISELAVRPRFRRRGIGRALLFAGLGRLRDLGLDTAHLFVETENPTGALRLYESAGFTRRWRCIQVATTIRE